MKHINHKSRGIGCLIAGLLFLATVIMLFTLGGTLLWTIVVASVLLIPTIILLIAAFAYLSYKEEYVKPSHRHKNDEYDEDYEDDYDYYDEDDELEEEEEEEEIEMWDH